MSPRNKALITASLAGLLTSCASGGQQDTDTLAGFIDDPRLGQEVDRICFASGINGFTQTTDRTVVLERGANDHFLVETVGACLDLDWAQSIGIDSFGSCLTRGDAIIASDSAFTLQRRGDPFPQRCLVKRIHEWDPDAADAPGDDEEPTSTASEA